MKIGIPQPPRSRIVYFSRGKTAPEELTTLLDSENYRVESRNEAQNADIAIVDIRYETGAKINAQSVVNNIRKFAPECSVIFLIEQNTEYTTRQALRRFGELIVADQAYHHVVARIRQITRLRNIAEETGERLKSLATMNRLGEFPPIMTPSTPPKVLVAGEPGPAALASTRACDAISAKSVSVFSPGQAMRALDHEQFDAAVFIAASDTDPMMSLLRALRRHPKHSVIPIICVARDADAAAALAVRGAQDFIIDDFIGDDMRSRIQLVARRGRLMRAMRGFLKACNGEGIRDAASGAFTSAFLTEHGAKLCARADQTRRPLSLTGVSLVAEYNDGTTGTPGVQALHKAAGVINRITRAEDVVVRITSDSFLVAMPSTIAEDAKKIALRIEGVLENTVFRDDKHDALFSISAISTTFERAPNMCIEEIVAQAVKDLRETGTSVTTSPLELSPQ